MHKQGVYYAPQHDQYRGRILEHYRRIKPAFSTVMTEDWRPISEVWQAHQHRICARVWAIDDGRNGDDGVYGLLNRDPEQAAWQMIQRYLQKRAEWYTNADDNPMPGHKHLYFHAWNEPNAHAPEEKIVEATKHLLRMGMERDIRFMVGIHSVGCPESYAAWEDAELEHLMLNSGAVYGAHGYWQEYGPMHSWTDETGKLREDYPYLAGRHHKFPLNIPIVIDECGIDGGIYGRHPGKGWGFYNLNERAYADQLHVNHNALDKRVIAQLPFTLDYQNGEWSTFDTFTALDAIEEWVASAEHDVPNTVHIPVVVVKPPETEDLSLLKYGPDGKHNPAPHDPKFERIISFILDAEGGLSTDRNDPGNYYNGQFVGTKYGISAASWAGQYNIPELTLEQAKAIYYWEYYRESGSDKLAWPLDLLTVNASVLHGVYRGVYFLTECKGNWHEFYHNQLTWITKIKTFNYHGAGWVRRMADLILEIGRGP